MADDDMFDDDDLSFSDDPIVELSEREERAQRRERYTELRRRVENMLEERRLRDDYGIYDLNDLILD